MPTRTAENRNDEFELDATGDYEPVQPVFAAPKWELITPEAARAYMGHNFSKNRHQRQAWIAELARSIRDGTYTPTHQGIAFNVDGDLIDGQHRLNAIIEANRPIWMLVSRGIPHDRVLAVDRGKTRNDRDNVAIVFDVQMSKTDIAVCRVMYSPWSKDASAVESLKGQALVDFYHKHEAAIRFASVQRKGARYPSVVRAIVAKAYYHVDHDRLNEFQEIILGGVPNGDQDSAAYRLHTFIKDKNSIVHLTIHRKAVVGKVMSSIQWFSQYRPMKSLQTTEHDYYPLP